MRTWIHMCDMNVICNEYVDNEHSMKYDAYEVKNEGNINWIWNT